jgi:hypothetical protein
MAAGKAAAGGGGLSDGDGVWEGERMERDRGAEERREERRGGGPGL